jgi:hypothetical protein
MAFQSTFYPTSLFIGFLGPDGKPNPDSGIGWKTIPQGAAT